MGIELTHLVKERAISLFACALGKESARFRHGRFLVACHWISWKDDPITAAPLTWWGSTDGMSSKTDLFYYLFILV